MRRTLLLTVVALLALSGAARASDPVGIYGLVEKVVLEPSADKPERAQVWGAFQLAKVRKGDDYTTPAYGYLYYALASGKEGDCRREWSDLKEVAGTGQAVAFAGRWQELGRVRKASEKAEKPDAYPVAGGMHKLNASGSRAKVLRSLALPDRPADGGQVAVGAVTLRARPIADKERKDVKYVFIIVNPAGDEEGSKPFAPAAGSKEVSWKPKMEVKAGEKYTWRVFAVAPDWRGPELTATFKGKSAP
jgi:hypothetical protein